MASWVIVGAGYTGGAVVRRLAAEGHEVVATRRSPGSTPGTSNPGSTPDDGTITLDLAQPPARTFPGAIVVCCAPPGVDPALEIQHLVELGGRRIVYVSSTGVYAPGGGAWVDESWPLAPVTRSGRARLEA